MWIFLNDAFLSIVAHRDEPEMLLVRSRFPDDIGRVFPDAVVEHTPAFDYPYRTVLARTEVAQTLAAHVETIPYPNFKNSIKEHWRHNTYFNVYNAVEKDQR
ncbi:MAG: hypothetical protein J5I90_10035 [Caldilineales bacterium]|nr:hypothetical protein [Caldilineales bacterium]